MKWLLPKSLVARLFVLYGAVLFAFLAGGFGVFWHYQFTEHLDEAHESAGMLVDLAAQAVVESALIGDYDTIKRTLQKTILRTPFRRAMFIDLAGGRMAVDSTEAANGNAPQWLRSRIAAHLLDVNRNIINGGRDYGVMRLVFDVDRVAERLWGSVLNALLVSAGCLIALLLLTFWLLKRWLGNLNRLHAFERRVASGDVGAEALVDRDAPTEIRRAVEVVNRIESHFRQSFELAGSGISHVGLDGRFIRANRKLCQILGYSADELIGRSVKEISHSDDRDVTDAPRARLYAGETDAMHVQKRYIRKDGAAIWADLTVSLVRDAEGKPQYEISVMEDITGDLTERKAAEQRQVTHSRYQEKISRLGQSALAERERSELIADATQSTMEAFTADAAAYVEHGPGEGNVVLREVVGLAEDAPTIIAQCGANDALTKVFQLGQPVTVRDGECPPLPFDWALTARSAALVPVRGENAARGTLCALSRRPHAFGDAELRFLEAAANVLSIGLRRIDSEARLALLAQFDALTGLPNRGLLSDRFSQLIVHARRHDKPLAVLFIDLDDFKLVNDTLGHAGGDELLKQVANRLTASVRAGDTVARISGDEFTVVLTELAKAEDAAIVAQKIIDALAVPVEIRGQETFASASIGIAAYPADGEDVETLLAAADAAMYRAKESQRNTYQFFTAEINERSRARAQLSSDLRRALERDEFRLFYQPKVGLSTGRACGLEALLRWQHPQRGMISPAEFIPVLEETGLIVPVGEWVLRQACEDLKAWANAGLPALPVAVNLSARQFRQRDLDARIRAIMAAAGVDASLIEIEITESQLMNDPEHAIRIMRGLREAGIRIAMDDFGTGYSSLGCLTQFPLAALKIDRSFVSDVLNDPADATIVRTIIEMAHSLGIEVVAEGVETEGQANFLRLLRCEQAQGYYFARPMPAADILLHVMADRPRRHLAASVPA